LWAGILSERWERFGKYRSRFSKYWRFSASTGNWELRTDMRYLAFFSVAIVLSAAFVAVGLLIAFWPATYARWVRWSDVERYVPWFFRGWNAYAWRSRIVGIGMALFGVIFAILTVYICWLQ
jgi:hypothetical protein